MVPTVKILVRGVGDIGSAVAHRLFGEGYSAALHDDPKPPSTRRGMAFADAIFDGQAVLEGVRAVHANDFDQVKEALAAHEAIPVCVRDVGLLLAAIQPRVLVDARMRKHGAPEVQRGLADLTIGLGPNLVAGRHADVVIETSWDGLGSVITDGASRPLAGEPREIWGHARDRYVYAATNGVFRTKAQIGDIVSQGQVLGEIRLIETSVITVTAPLDGMIRGLTRDDVPVTVKTKIVEVDPRGVSAEAWGIGERPRRIAEGVVSAVRRWEADRT
jgi:xanthine dehydrogenase accessory factor